MNYATMARRCARLLRDYGQPLTLRRPPVLDFGSGLETAETRWCCSGVRLQETASPWTEAGPLLEANMTRWLVTPDVTPRVGDCLLASGEVWRVERAEPVRPAGVTLFHTITACNIT